MFLAAFILFYFILHVPAALHSDQWLK